MRNQRNSYLDASVVRVTGEIFNVAIFSVDEASRSVTNAHKLIIRHVQILRGGVVKQYADSSMHSLAVLQWVLVMV